MGEFADMALSQLLDQDEVYQSRIDEFFDDDGETLVNPFMRTRMAQTSRMTPPRRQPPKSASPQKRIPTTKPKTVQRKSEGGFCGFPALMGVLYGPPGVGKTDLAANFPDPVFIIDPKEQGIHDLLAYKRCPEPLDIVEVDTFELLKSKCLDVANGRYPDCKTLALDSMTGMEFLCFHHHCLNNFGGDWSKEGFYAFQNGPKNAAKTDWPDFLDVLCDVQRAGINVLLIGHSQAKSFDNPEGADYARYTPYLDKETWAQTHRWAQFIFFYNYYVDTEGKGQKKKANLDSETRNIYTERSAVFDAKNRAGLDPIIPAGSSGKEAYEAIVEAFEALNK